MATKTNEKTNKNKKTKLVIIIICIALLLGALSFILVSCLGGASYTVTFDCLGGNINRVPVLKVDVKKGHKVEKPQNPSKKYYDFLTWQDEDKNEFDFDNTVINQDITLYASYEAIVYTIEYKLDTDGVNDSRNPATYTCEDEFPLYPATRDGFSFDGWYVDGKGSTTIDRIKKGSHGNIKLEAKWNTSYYNLTVESNDTFLGTVALTSHSSPYAKGELYSVTATPNSYCKFEGWYIDDKLVSTETTAYLIMPSHDVRIVGKFVNTTYTITYILDGGTNDPRNVSSYYPLQGVHIYPATKEGYEFLRWENQYGEETSYLPLGASGDLVLTAIFAKIYTITYNIAEDETLSAGNPTSFLAGEGAELFYASKPNHSFVGWKDQDGNIYSSTIPATVEKDLILTPIFDEIGFNITYILDGGTNDPRNPTKYNNLTAKMLYEPTKPGYTFLYWEDQYGHKFYDHTNIGFDYDLVLTAIWEEEVIKDKYTLTTIVNDLVDLSIYGQNTATGDGEFVPGAEVTVTAKKSVAMFIRFVGWYLDDECVSTNLSYTFTMPKRDITLVATFTLK